MKIQTYTPTEAMVAAVQWPENPTGQDFNDLKHWVGDDLEVLPSLVGDGRIRVGRHVVRPSDYLVRNDDEYNVYSKGVFEDNFREVK